ncbi:MAG: AMP-binding protein, partial [Candidatus Sifarchaeia archaeon]
MDRPWYKNYVGGTPKEITVPDGPLWEGLNQAVKNFTDNIAIYYEGVKITYRELGELVARAANGFTRLGVKKGDNVAIMLNNCPQFIIAYYGALKCGATITPVNPLAMPKELRIYLQDSGAKTIVVLNFFYKVVEAVREETNLENVIVTAAWDMMSKIKQVLAPKLVYRKEMKEVPVLREGDHQWNDWLANTVAEVPSITIEPGKDIAVYQFTGGTTGIPKAAMLTHDNLKANCEQCSAWMEWMAERGKESFVAALPLQHIFGQTISMNLAILWGSTIVLVPNARDIKHLLELIDKTKPTFFPIVSTLAIAIYSHPEVAKYDIT